jgi:RNA polymerase-binding transcription factor DksA
VILLGNMNKGLCGGIMAEFLTTRGISHTIENIIREAKKEIVIVSPYLKVSGNLVERLREAASKGVRIIFIYGKCDIDPNVIKELNSIQKLEKWFYQDLHAKCYLNEERAIITSMNLHAYSEINNREMGILIDRVSDNKLYADARVEVVSIKMASTADKTEMRVPVEKIKQNTIKRNKHQGHCIRCGKPITFNPDKPYCRDCFEIWAQFENPEYEEDFCHSCGELYPANMLKPLCRSCYKKTSFFN